jgi:hypothetical protein
VHLATARAQAKEVAPTTSCEGYCPAFTRASQNVAAAAMLLGMQPSPSADVVGMLYR